MPQGSSAGVDDPFGDDPAGSQAHLNELAAQVLRLTSDAAMAGEEQEPLMSYSNTGKGSAQPDLRDMPGPEGDGTSRGMTHPGYRGTFVPAQIPKGGFTTEPWTAGRLWERAAVPGILYEPFDKFSQLYTHFKNGGSEFDDAAVDAAFEIALSMTGATNFKSASKEAMGAIKGLKSGNPSEYIVKEMGDSTFMVEGPNHVYFATSKSEAKAAASYFTKLDAKGKDPSFVDVGKMKNNLSEEGIQTYKGAQGPEYNEAVSGARSLKDQNAPRLIGDPDGNWKVVGQGASGEEGATHWATVNFGQGARAKKAAEDHLKKVEDAYLFGDLDKTIKGVMDELDAGLTKQTTETQSLLKKLNAAEILDEVVLPNGKTAYYIVDADKKSLSIVGAGHNQKYGLALDQAGAADKAWKDLVNGVGEHALDRGQMAIKDPKNPFGFPPDYLWASTEAGARAMEQFKGNIFNVKDASGKPITSATKFLYDNRDDPVVMGALKIANDNKIKAVHFEDGVVVRFPEHGKAHGITASPSVIGPPKKVDLPTEQQIMNWPGSRKIQSIGENEEFNGPIIMYHGTSANFDKFDLSKVADFGHHFGTPGQAARRSMAEGFEKTRQMEDFPTNEDKLAYIHNDKKVKDVRIIPVVFEGEKSMTMPDLGSWRPAQVARWIEKNEPKEAKGFTDFMYDLENKGEPTRILYAEIRNKLNALGYDSVRYLNTVEGKGWSYIVWRPSRIKSATNPDKVLYSSGSPGLTLGADAAKPEDAEPRSP